MGAGWAVGATAVRLEDWPLARQKLEAAITLAETEDSCQDLLAFALADLAKACEAAGDVIEARRLVLRAMTVAREQDIHRFFPERWQVIVSYARSLELDP